MCLLHERLEVRVSVKVGKWLCVTALLCYVDVTFKIFKNHLNTARLPKSCRVNLPKGPKGCPIRPDLSKTTF